MRFSKLIFSFLALALVLMPLSTQAAKDYKSGKGNQTNNKITAQPSPTITKFNINNVSTWFNANGDSDLDNAGNPGFIYPLGSGKTAFFESGFLYGGEINGEWRVGGSTYNHSQVPGRIMPDGTAESPDAEVARIWRVRPDYADPDADYSNEIMDENKTREEIYNQYHTDWQNWPAYAGAPYEDVDGDGQYNPDVDIPGVPGADQTIWFVNNDVALEPQLEFYGSPGLGLEMQATIWGYKQSGALGNSLFRKYKLINKGGNQIDSFYVCMWSDPDMGEYTDDFAGSDTTLSLGYIYNGEDHDDMYGTTVPAAGFDFFQGPIVPAAGQTAIFDGKLKEGYRNLPMSSFFFFINSDAVYTDPTLGDYDNGALQMRNLFEGKISGSGVPFTDPTTGQHTKFTLAGDPITGRGWIDGILHQPGDRRFGMVAGPLEMAPGDTQEVVVGQFIAGGSEGIDRLGAVGLLKYYDLQLQQAYDNFFDVPNPPAAPIVNVTPFDQEVVLSWAENKERVQEIESHNELGYEFEGYVVYQLPRAGSTLDEARVVATFDKQNLVTRIESQVFDTETNSITRRFTKFGEDSGIKRYITIDRDLFRSYPLVNGTEYYFAVTAYSYNDDPNAVPNVLESAPQIYRVVPQTADPGFNYGAEVEGAIEVEHAEGSSDGIVTVTVVDPSKLAGGSYEITFEEDTDTSSATYGELLWTLKGSGGNVLLEGMPQYAPEDIKTDAPIIDGMQIIVQGPPPGVSAIQEESQDGEILDGTVGILTPSLGTTGYILNNLLGAASGDLYDSDFDRFDFWGNDDVSINFGEESLAWEYINEYVVGDGSYKVPFSVYRHKYSDGSTVRLFAGFYDGDGSNDWNPSWEDPVWGVPAYEPIFAWQGYDADGNEIEYDPANEAQYLADNDLYTSANTTWGSATGEFPYPFLTSTLVSLYLEGADYPEGNVIRIVTNKKITEDDVYTFTAPSNSYSDEQAKEDVKAINVFPNPYYAVNPREVNKYERFVTFNHLPDKATLRIFNLAGQLVRTLEKSDPSQYFQWDLTNEASYPVASGLYIVHIDMPDLGETKILKLAVVQEQQILDKF